MNSLLHVQQVYIKSIISVCTKYCTNTRMYCCYKEKPLHKLYKEISHTSQIRCVSLSSKANVLPVP